MGGLKTLVIGHESRPAKRKAVVVRAITPRKAAAMMK